MSSSYMPVAEPETDSHDGPAATIVTTETQFGTITLIGYVEADVPDQLVGDALHEFNREVRTR